MSDVHEASVQAGHDAPDFGQIDVADGEVLFAALALKLYEAFVFEQGDRYLLGLNINNYFACHYLF